MPRLVVVDDEANLRAALEEGFTHYGFETRSAPSARTALELIREWRPDVIILDVMMPLVDGLSIVPAIRRMTEAPIIMLSARTDVETRIRGLDIGADDYVAKPFEFSELVARVRRALRRPRIESRNEILYADVRVDLDSRTVTRAGRAVPALSRYEFDLFVAMLRQPRRVFTREQLLNMVWGEESETTEASVERFISFLRAKVDAGGDASPLIRTVRGVGYCIRSDHDGAR